jgi:hypothetical protein
MERNKESKKVRQKENQGMIERKRKDEKGKERKEVLGSTNRQFLPTERMENDASNNSSIVTCVFIAAVTFLPSRCLAMIRGYID